MRRENSCPFESDEAYVRYYGPTVSRRWIDLMDLIYYTFGKLRSDSLLDNLMCLSFVSFCLFL